MREVTNAILYILGTGCQWRALPKDFPPRTTVFEYLDLWEWDGTLGRLHHALFLATREQADKEASPTAAIIDSQSVKGAERGARIDPSGYDAGKKVKGKKRHILVDTLGLPLNVVVHPANIQDRDSGLLVLKAVRRLFPLIERIFADGGYASRRLHSTSPRPLATRNRGAAPIIRSVSRFCPSDGSSNVRSHGSVAAAASPRTTKTGHVSPSPTSILRRPASCSDALPGKPT